MLLARATARFSPPGVPEGVTRGTQAKPLGGSETLAEIAFSAIPESSGGNFLTFQDDVQKIENALLAQATARFSPPGVQEGVTRGTQAKPLGGSETLAKQGFQRFQSPQVVNFDIPRQRTEN